LIDIKVEGQCDGLSDLERLRCNASCRRRCALLTSKRTWRVKILTPEQNARYGKLRGYGSPMQPSGQAHRH